MEFRALVLRVLGLKASGFGGLGFRLGVRGSRALGFGVSWLLGGWEVFGGFGEGGGEGGGGKVRELH